MTTNPNFSFVMPAYKGRFIKEAIKSILAQTYTDFEVIVVNDCSPEPLRDIVAPFCADPRVRYEENEENIGGHDLVGNWNHCLRFASGEWVVLATDDDMFSPSYLADAVSMMDSHPESSLIRQGVRKIEPQGEPIEYELLMPEHLDPAEFAYYWGMGIISCVSNFIFRREKLLAMGGFIAFPHAHYSDVATALAMSCDGVVNVPRYNLMFRMSDINLSNTMNLSLTLGQIDATWQFMEWLERHLQNVEDNTPGRFYAVRAWLGFRIQHRRMMENLISKIPRWQLLKAVAVILRCRHLYKKEKLKLFVNYLIG